MIQYGIVDGFANVLDWTFGLVGENHTRAFDARWSHGGLVGGQDTDLATGHFLFMNGHNLWNRKKIYAIRQNRRQRGIVGMIMSF